MDTDTCTGATSSYKENFFKEAVELATLQFIHSPLATSLQFNSLPCVYIPKATAWQSFALVAKFFEIV